MLEKGGENDEDAKGQVSALQEEIEGGPQQRHIKKIDVARAKIYEKGAVEGNQAEEIEIRIDFLPQEGASPQHDENAQHGYLEEEV